MTTMGSTVDSFTKTMFELAKGMRLKADLLFRDLIEPSDLYCKHYTATNSILIEQASEIWMDLTQARTQMLFAKETYFNQMHQLTQLERQVLKDSPTQSSTLVHPGL